MVLLSLLAVLALAVAGCGGDDNDSAADAGTGAGTAASTGAATTEAPKKAVRIAFIGPLANTYQEATFKGFEEVVKKEGGTVKWIDSTFDPAKEFAVVQDAASSGLYDAIAFTPLSSASLVPAAKQALEKGLMVVNMNFVLGSDLKATEVQIEGQTGAVYTPTYERGKRFGETVKAACEGIPDCKVGWMASIAGTPWDQALLAGAKEVLKPEKSIRFVSEQAGGAFQAEAGLKVAQNMLQAAPNMDVLVTTGDQSTYGAELALKRLNRDPKEIKLIGYGGGCIATKAVKEGRWFADVNATPFSEGQNAAQIIFDVANGKAEPPVVIDAIAKLGAPPVLTAENVDEYECQYEG